MTDTGRDGEPPSSTNTHPVSSSNPSSMIRETASTPGGTVPSPSRQGHPPQRRTVRGDAIPLVERNALPAGLLTLTWTKRCPASRSTRSRPPARRPLASASPPHAQRRGPRPPVPRHLVPCLITSLAEDARTSAITRRSVGWNSRPFMCPPSVPHHSVRTPDARAMHGAALQCVPLRAGRVPGSSHTARPPPPATARTSGTASAKPAGPVPGGRVTTTHARRRPPRRVASAGRRPAGRRARPTTSTARPWRSPARRAP